MSRLNTGTPYLCPVCNGKRVLNADFYPDEIIDGSLPVCRTCNGIGVLWTGATISSDNGKVNPMTLQRLIIQQQKIASRIIRS